MGASACMKAEADAKRRARVVQIALGDCSLEGTMDVPDRAVGVVLFPVRTGSGRPDTGTAAVARSLERSRIGTLLFELPSTQARPSASGAAAPSPEQATDADRVIAVTRWVARQPEGAHLGLGYFGDQQTTGAVLAAAATLGWVIDAMVLLGGPPDLPGRTPAVSLPELDSPTLMIVGELDGRARERSARALAGLRCTKKLAIIQGRTSRAGDPDSLAEISTLTRGWFSKHLRPR